MSLPSTEELKRLQGRRDLPWKVTENHAVTDRFGWSIFVDEDNRTACVATPQDAQLVALAPELLAEVIPLRRELGTYINHLNDMADKDKHMPKYALDAISSALTRILEGGSDA
ncbi:hypothetical protein ACEN2D_02290 [Corynebacterium auriscanis]|uniref:hypothetical protein n=1 Tax=Corynebacterium auriscanis TaxID=99807 RepID=UPI003CF75AD0